jgi:HEAT repeat protein
VTALIALTDPSESRNLRQAALNYLAGRSDKAPAIATATTYLDDPDPLFAVSAVQTLARIGGPAGKETLQQRLTVEKRVTVSDAIREALKP